jgi:PhzF family phenazine biosynthesis protein
MAIPICTVDSFTAEPFRGNPAGVCLLSAPREAAWMQSVAAEMNLSETAFLHQEGEVLRLRWFTPKVEVELCGHATLASAHVLWETGRLAPAETARFETLSGRLAAVRRGQEIELDFPATPPEPAAPPPALLAALGPACARPRFVGRTRFDWLVEIDSEASVRALRPDFAPLRSLGSRGVIVTSAASTRPFDFVSRYFAPAVGIDEDPATGSSHSSLAPYWRERTGRDEMAACQLSARGGVLRVRVAGDRVALGGRAVTVFRGELAVD